MRAPRPSTPSPIHRRRARRTSARSRPARSTGPPPTPARRTRAPGTPTSRPSRSRDPAPASPAATPGRWRGPPAATTDAVPCPTRRATWRRTTRIAGTRPVSAHPVTSRAAANRRTTSAGNRLSRAAGARRCYCGSSVVPMMSSTVVSPSVRTCSWWICGTSGAASSRDSTTRSFGCSLIEAPPRDRYYECARSARLDAMPQDERIRRVEPRDVESVVRLVHGLAEYERAPDECHLTAEQLREALFRPGAALFGNVAEVAGEVVGCALWFLNFSTWRGVHGIYLEDLYVDPAHRGSGLGKALLVALAQECVRNGYERFEWA